jgi:hypothetical protein
MFGKLAIIGITIEFAETSKFSLHMIGISLMDPATNQPPSFLHGPTD